MDYSLHIVSFDIPYPANYGGAIDVFYRLKALHELGVKIKLHCFEYWRVQAPELNKYCQEVYYYKRHQKFIYQFRKTPYAVYNRKNEALIENLLQDTAPILFEGLVCCYYLDDERLAHRKKLFRECNIEHHYYRGLAAATSDMRKKLYYTIEAYKMERYERVLTHADIIIALSTADLAYFKQKFPGKRVLFIPCFHANEEITSQIGQSDFLLYHGNLSLAENENAALYLCQHVFGKLPYRCVIAGLNPTVKLRHQVKHYSNIELITNPSQKEMDQLVAQAQINLLITFQATGLKLKLLNTLFAGRYVIANDKMLSGSGLDTLCYIANNANQQIRLCQELMQKPFSELDIDLRRVLLIPQFDNREQAKVLLKIIY